MNQYYNKRMAELKRENPYCYRLNENPITKDLEYKKDLKKNLIYLVQVLILLPLNCMI